MSCWSFAGCAEENSPGEGDAVQDILSCQEDADCPADICQRGVCIEGGCTSVPRAKVPCDDGDACTEVDICNGTGICVGSVPKTCPDDGDNPCVRGVCDPGTGGCGFELDPSAAPPSNRCWDYQCVDGVLDVSANHDCDDRMGPLHGCVERYECEPQYVHPLDGSPCRPVNKPVMSACMDANGDHIIPSSVAATAFQPSECNAHVCYAATEQGESDCIDSLDLPTGVAQKLRDQGNLPIHACSLDDLPEGDLGSCNAIRCVCAGGDCSSTSNASCQIYPVKDEEEPCDTGNPCDIGRCLTDDLGSLRCAVVDEVDCDAYPNSTCDTWLPCDPAMGGCPLTMLTPASHANCHTGNACIVEEDTFCAPLDPNADPETGCVTQFLDAGEPCFLGVQNSCVQETRCLPTNENELVCQSTGYLCNPTTACQILVGCEVECDYLKLDGTYCEDDAACTDTAMCEDGICVGVPTPGACDDGDPCTVDLCSQAAQSCVYTSIPGCKNSLCDLTGKAGDTVTCSLHLFREAPSTPVPVGGRLVFEYATDVLDLVNFRLNACPPNGPCELMDLSAAQPANPGPPHAIATHPSNLAAWNGYGVLYVIPSTALKPVSNLLKKPGSPPPGKHTFEVDLLLKEDILPGMAVPFGLLSGTMASAEGSLLVGSASVNRIDLCESNDCPVGACGDEPFPDGCGGEMMCPCDTACAYHGCAKNNTLQPSKREPHSGDINDDGKVDFLDASLYRARVWGVLAGAAPSEEQAFPDTCIDLNCDGLIDPMDLTRATQLAIAEFQANWGSLAGDYDDDGIHDRCDNDSDNDGFPDVCEWQQGSGVFDDASTPNEACTAWGCVLPTDACFNLVDLNTLEQWSEEFEVHCVDACPLNANYGSCLEACLRDSGGLTPSCSYCRAERRMCLQLKCGDDCAEESIECLNCIFDKCEEDYATCTGLETQCADDVDNNGDNQIDCLDPSCNLSFECSMPKDPGPCAKQIKSEDALNDATMESLLCAKTCAQQEVYPVCMDSCLDLLAGLKGTCLDCFYVMASCSLEQCNAACSEPGSIECGECMESLCGPAFQSCAKIEFEVVGSCESPSDADVNFFLAAMSGQACQDSCAWQPEKPNCLAECLEEATGLSTECIDCYTGFFDCATAICEADCADGFSPECGQCSMVFCGTSFEACSGTPLPGSP